MSQTHPFACNMNALSPTERARHHELVGQLRPALKAVHEPEDGYNFEFPFTTANYQTVAELTPLEHACCPFFSISIRIEPSHHLFWRLAGQEGAKAVHPDGICRMVQTNIKVSSLRAV